MRAVLTPRRQALLALVLAPLAPVRATSDPVEELLDGVHEIAAPGTPGGVCAFGPEAFAVVVAADDQPVVAGSQAGGGRCLALGHDGYLSAGALGTADTARFFRNALRWLSGGKRKPNVACPDGAQLAEALRALGVRAEADLALEEADVCVLDGGRALAPARIAEIAAFVAAGRGLLVAATGWGWQQVSPDELLARDLSGNRLLVPFGLAFSLESAAKTGAVGLLTSPRPSRLAHAGTCFEAVLADRVPPEEEPRVLARLGAALACLPDHEPTLVRPLRSFLEAAALETGGDVAGVEPKLVERYRQRAWRPLDERIGPWYVVGPFQQAKGGRNIVPPQPPERTLDAMAVDGPGPDVAADFRRRGGRIGWTLLDARGDGCELDVGEIRFDAALAPLVEEEDWTLGAAAYLYRAIETDAERELVVRVGSDDGMRLWCNGALLLDKNLSRGIELDEEEVVLGLERGVNHVLVKVANVDGTWGFRMRRSESGVTQAAINAAIDRGVAWLCEHQLVDGSWGAEAHYGPAYTAYAAYALLESQVERDHPAVRRALAYARTHEAPYTYTLACKALALAAYERTATPELQGVVDALVELQVKMGLFGYPVYPDGTGRPEDLSNTLYAALGLRAAAAVGAKVPERTWLGLIDGALACLHSVDSGSRSQCAFAYRVGEGEPTGSMTTAGLSVLLVACQALGSALDGRLARRIDEVLAGGLAWIEERMTWRANPGQARWQLFFLYGIERVGSLLEVEVLGKVRWYRSGAEYLVERQGAKGEWTAEEGGDAAHDTILALLFLNKATAPKTGRNESARDLHAAEGPGLDVSLRAKGHETLDVWITDFADWVRREYAWPKGQTKEPRIERVLYVARTQSGEEVVLAEVAGKLDGSLQRFEARVSLPGPGVYELFARVNLLQAPMSKGLVSERASLTSGVLRIEVPASEDPAVFAYAEQGARNLLQARARAEASSGAAELAADGSQATSWVCAPDDPAPRWKIRLERAVEADRVLLSHAWPNRANATKPRASVVEVAVDGEVHRVELDPDRMRKTMLALSAPRTVLELEVRVVESSGRALGADGVGLAEVELLLER